MTDVPKGPQDRSENDAEATTEIRAQKVPLPAPSEPTRALPTAWERIPKTIPHTRARTSTVVLGLLFLGLMWWYLDLYAQFVPEEQRRTGQTPVATTTAPAQEKPAYDAPVTTTPPRAPSSAVPSSGVAGESGAPSSTVPGRSGEPGTATTGGSTTTSAPGGIVLPGGVTPSGIPGTTTESPTTGGAPTTTLPPG
ncbi:hypothetical protein [Tsukamurella ocularis]|uniref:hypothetical protein n=1 Tax=Tsukamurella ocularis TaxID=1970234 RepID=UPI00216753C6|nr:hypothetical protein [Tsukamurella ocularis]MCS3781766.1 hypothetical protein [Tsukamurella ocularis]MCS3788260.1 hypothetical protein [Tsukamurella ocularis]MCS3851980.1 hypothetical protein [Tsukamurella ocularis]